MKRTGVDGIMIARAAWQNPGIFSTDPIPPKTVSVPRLPGWYRVL